MRPDRIIVGEVRGDEVLDMLQAMNTGHDGSLTTIHANSPRDALLRLETLMAMSGLKHSERGGEEVCKLGAGRGHSGFPHDGRQQKARFPSRKSSAWRETRSPCRRSSASNRRASIRNGRVEGSFRMQGVMPRFFEKFKVHGVTVPYDMFEMARAGLAGITKEDDDFFHSRCGLHRCALHHRRGFSCSEEQIEPLKPGGSKSSSRRSQSTSGAEVSLLGQTRPLSHVPWLNKFLCRFPLLRGWIIFLSRRASLIRLGSLCSSPRFSPSSVFFCCR